MRFFIQSARTLDKDKRVALLKAEKRISLKKKCELLNLNRSGLYYKKQPVCDYSELVQEIQSIYLAQPFFGYRKVHVILSRSGYAINKKKVQRLMQENNLRAIVPKRNIYSRNKAHKIYPYLLKRIDIIRPNQAWQVDITYIKIKSGFVYLICLIDVYSRKAMGWHLSTLLDTDSCLIALHNALENGEIPEIINSDQGSQFTSDLWCAKLKAHDIQISMDGKGRWADNIYIERLWRTIKYELFYLYRFETVQEARIAVANYFKFYNTKRPHQSLSYKVPEIVYNQGLQCKLLLKEVKQILPFAGVNNNSQIFANFLS